MQELTVSAAPLLLRDLRKAIYARVGITLCRVAETAAFVAAAVVLFATVASLLHYETLIAAEALRETVSSTLAYASFAVDIEFSVLKVMDASRYAGDSVAVITLLFRLFCLPSGPFFVLDLNRFNRVFRFEVVYFCAGHFAEYLGVNVLLFYQEQQYLRAGDVDLRRKERRDFAGIVRK